MNTIPNNFDVINVYTTLFNCKKLLFTVYKNAVLDDFTQDNNFINISDKRNHYFDGYILKGFREHALIDGHWIEKELYSDQKSYSSANPIINSYLLPKKAITSSFHTFQDINFDVFVQNHENNKFYQEKDLLISGENNGEYFIIDISSGIFDIIKDLCCNANKDYSENEKKIMTYIFSTFSFDYIENIKKLVLDIYKETENTKDYSDIFVDSFLSKIISNDYFFEIYETEKPFLCSSDISFSVPILYRDSILQNDIEAGYFTEILNVFNFYGNIIPLSSNKCVIISKFKIVNLDNMLIKDLFYSVYFYNILKEYYHWSVYYSDSLKDVKNDNLKIIRNSIFRYSSYFYDETYIDTFRNILFERNEESFNSKNKEHIAFFINKFLFNDLIDKNNIITTIELSKIIEELYEQI